MKEKEENKTKHRLGQGEVSKREMLFPERERATKKGRA